MQKERNYVDRLWACTNVADGLYNKIAKAKGIKDNMFALFYALADGGAHSQKEICEQYLIPKTTLNTIVMECMENGYISLEREEHTKEKQMTLTKQGRRYALSILGPVHEAEQTAMAATLKEFSPEFISALEHFTKVFQQEVEKTILQK